MCLCDKPIWSGWVSWVLDGELSGCHPSLAGVGCQPGWPSTLQWSAGGCFAGDD